MRENSLIQHASKREMLNRHLREMNGLSVDRTKFPTIQLFQDLRTKESELRKEFYHSPVLMAWGTQALREASISGEKRSPVHIFSTDHTTRKLNIARGQAERGIADFLEESIEYASGVKAASKSSQATQQNLQSVRNALSRFPVRASQMLRASKELLSLDRPTMLCGRLIQYLDGLNKDAKSEPDGMTATVSSRGKEAKELLARLAEVADKRPEAVDRSLLTSTLDEIRSNLEEIKKLSSNDKSLSTRELIFLSRVQFALESGTLGFISSTDEVPSLLSIDKCQENKQGLIETTDRCLELRSLIVHSNWRLALSGAKKFWQAGVRARLDPSDILSIAYNGLLEAIDRFDPSLGLQFSTMASTYIRGYIQTGLNSYKFQMANAAHGRRAIKLQQSIWDGRTKQDVQPPLDGLALVRDSREDEELRERLREDIWRQPQVITHVPEDPSFDIQFQELSGPLNWKDFKVGFGVSDPNVRVVPLQPDLFDTLRQCPQPESKYIACGGNELPGDIGLLQLISPSQVAELMRLTQPILSIDQHHEENEFRSPKRFRLLKNDIDGRSGRLIASSVLSEEIQSTVKDPADSAMEQELYEGDESVLGQLLAELPERSQKVMKLRFGIDRDRPYTLEEIAKKIGVSKERVRQIESKSLESLQFELKKDRYQDLRDQEKPQLW